MSNWKDWQELKDKTEVCSKDGKFYLKAYPEQLYETYEEAQEVSNSIRDIIVF